MAVALKILPQPWRCTASTNLEIHTHCIRSIKWRPTRYLPVFISVDEPELHLSPLFATSRTETIIVNNCDQWKCWILALIKQLYQMMFIGVLFVVTHIQMHWWWLRRHMIYACGNDEMGLVRAFAGWHLNLFCEVEKHLIMHFRSEGSPMHGIILVEGETEYRYSSFAATKIKEPWLTQPKDDPE